MGPDLKTTFRGFGVVASLSHLNNNVTIQTKVFMDIKPGEKLTSERNLCLQSVQDKSALPPLHQVTNMTAYQIEEKVL